MRAVSAREKVILVSGAFVLLALFELFLRVLPERKALHLVEQENERLLALKAPAPVASDAELAKLVSRRAELEKKVQVERAAVARLELAFSRDEAETLVAISDLAERAGVVVRRSEPCRADDLGRPCRRFVVVATFSALRELLAGLASLPRGPVHVDRLEIESVPLPAESDDADPRVLVATLVLVL